MTKYIEVYPHNSIEDNNLTPYLNNMHKYYNNKIRQKIKFKNKRVDFGKYFLTEYEIYEQFGHISSFSEADKNYYIPNPCIKLKYNNFCQNCIDKIKLIKVKREERAICIYRVSLLPLLKNIFVNINISNFENITIYEEEIFINKKCKKDNFIHIRYEDENIYYYIKLKEVIDEIRGNYYSFYCAFPVFNGEKIKELNRLFGKVKRN